MQLKPHQLASQLKKKLMPVYILTGDEPLQLGELADLIRTTARDAGFTHREVFSVDTPGFNWNQLIEASQSQSIFADKQLLEVRMTSGSPGIEGAKTLTHYCQQATDGTLLLITAGKIPKDALKSRWFQTLDRTGVSCQVWPLDGNGLLAWLEKRLLDRGMVLEPGSIKLLASKVEGNLLAAAQEVEKLYVLYGAGPLSNPQVMAAVTDNSRYDVFNLVDACLAADCKKILKILGALAQEGIAAPIVVWALSREARILAKIKWQVSRGMNLETADKNLLVNNKRKHLIRDAIDRLNTANLDEIIRLNSKADRQSKGQETGDSWETLQDICFLFAGIRTNA